MYSQKIPFKVISLKIRLYTFYKLILFYLKRSENQKAKYSTIFLHSLVPVNRKNSWMRIVVGKNCRVMYVRISACDGWKKKKIARQNKLARAFADELSFSFAKHRICKERTSCTNFPRKYTMSFICSFDTFYLSLKVEPVSLSKKNFLDLVVHV